MSIRFLKNYVVRPVQVGAVWPSSPGLCRMMVSHFDWASARHVIEYGPGTGVVTPYILERLHPDARFFAIEQNPDFCQSLRNRIPNLDLAEGSVEHVVDYCRERNFPNVDAIVCGLPWAAFPEALQTRCLDAMAEVLKPGSQFASFAYSQFLFLPAAKRFRRKLNDYFSEVKVSPVVWRNLPPAIVYQCRV